MESPEMQNAEGRRQESKCKAEEPRRVRWLAAVGSPHFALCIFHSALCILFFFAFLGCGETTVEAVRPRRGEIRESFAEPARTRLATTYPVTLPVAGRIARIALEPGDAVKAGQALAAFDLVPFQTAVAEAQAAVDELNAEMAVKDDNRLEETALVETEALVKATDEALKASDEEVAAEKARADNAARTLARKKVLATKSVIAQEELDNAELLAVTSVTDLRKEEFYRAALKAFSIAVNLGPRAIREYLGRKTLERKVLVERLAQAKARLAAAQHELALAQVKSPIDGVVLERYEQGDSALPAGQRLLLLGNLGELEVVADVLTQDALRLAPGSQVSLRPAAGRQELPGKVTRIDPAGFTKLSSLGVEQQRVNVIVGFAEKPKGLGVGYRVQATFLTGSKADALIVPRFAVLQAPDGAYYVFKIADGRLVRQSVKLGLRSDLELEVTEGLSESDLVVARPDATMKAGERVEIRHQEGTPTRD